MVSFACEPPLMLRHRHLENNEINGYIHKIYKFINKKYKMNNT